MEKSMIEVEVISIIRKVLGDDNARVQASNRLIDDLELSSLEVFELISLLEDRFECTIEEKVIREFVTVGDVIDFVVNVKNKTED